MNLLKIGSTLVAGLLTGIILKTVITYNPEIGWSLLVFTVTFLWGLSIEWVTNERN